MPRTGAAARVGAGASGLPMATYTAVLIANTAVPAWHVARHELPFVFAAGAGASAGAAAAIATPRADAAPARRLTVLGAVGAQAAAVAMERRLGPLAESYRSGDAGRYRKLARGLMLGGALLVGGAAGAAARPRWPAGSRCSGGAVAERWSVFRAGFHSALDPRQTVATQRGADGRGAMTLTGEHGQPTRRRAPIERVPVVRVRDGVARGASDAVAAEEPLEIRIDGERVAVTMRTPVLGRGRGAGARVPARRGDRRDAGRGARGRVPLRDAARTAASPTCACARTRSRAPGWQRRFYATSSCGICGKESIEAVRVAAAPLDAGTADRARRARPRCPASCARASARSRAPAACTRPACSRPTGASRCCARTSAATTPSTRSWARAAMDELVPPGEHVLLVSGRASFEITQKALVAGIPVLAAVSAPSSLAVRLARESGMTLVGFLRDGDFNVYAGRERIAGL